MAWLIESGSYSDYGVTAVAPDEETAKAVCSRLNEIRTRYDEFECSEVPTITSPDQIHRVVWQYAELKYRNGVCTSRLWDYTDIEFDPYDKSASVQVYDDGGGNVRVIGRSLDADLSLRIAGDRLTQWRAERELEPPAQVASR